MLTQRAPSVSTPPEPQGLPVARRCSHCGSLRTGAYCSDCGQKVQEGRFTLPSLLREGWGEVVKLDRGFLRTALDLSVRPGHMVRDYVEGRTRPYVNPVKYLLVVAAAAAFLFLWTGSTESAAYGPGGAGGAELTDQQAQALAFFTRYFNVFLILIVPFFALATRAVFRKSGYTVAEHGIFAAYLFAQGSLISVALLPVLVWFRDDPGVSLPAYAIPITVHYLWACRQFFAVGPLAAVGRGLLVTSLAWLGYLVAMSLAMLAYMIVSS